MRKPVVDYRNFRLSKLKTPEYSHLLLLLGWVGYFLLYLLTENLIPYDACHVIHIPLDDKIPFMEIFVIPYVSWYVLIVFSLGYFALYNVDHFRKLQTYIIFTQAIAMVVYIIYPSYQDLRRPELLPDNFLADIVRIIYTFDTPTGVFPSLHVGYSLGIASVWLREKTAHPLWKTIVVIWIALICMSICFIKQHSAADFFAALPMCLVVELIVFRKEYFKKRYKKEADHA